MPISLDDILTRLGGDRDLLREVAAVFLDDTPKQLERLRQAMAAADAVAVASAAHSLKGAIANFDSGEAFQLAAAIEIAARDDPSQHSEADLRRLELALGELMALLKSA